MKKVLVVFGTRPEAIKFFPVVKAFQARSDVEVVVCVTAQHREMLDQVLTLAEITPDIDLNMMRPGQTLPRLTADAISQLSDVVAQVRPDWLLVQGDTTTSMSAAMAAFYNKVPVGHVEAGLRSGDIYSPWPEEVNRKIVSAIAALHFPPTEASRENLLRENIPESAIRVTGNTVIDALLYTQGLLDDPVAIAPYLDALPPVTPGKKLVLVTTHRREHFDGGLARIFEAVNELARRDDVEIILPMHPNPNVRDAIRTTLAASPNVKLIEPLQYVPFVWLMAKSHIILSDSGGVQEEAPSLGKPVLVLRDTTERPEGVDAGTARLVGTDTATILREARSLLDDDEAWRRMSQRKNPYGDGHASERIVEAILNA